MNFVPVSETERTQALAMIKAGDSTGEIAKTLNVKPDRIRYIAKANGVRLGSPKKKPVTTPALRVVVPDNKPTISPQLEKLLASVRQRMQREHIGELTLGADGQCTLRFHQSVTVDV